MECASSHFSGTWNFKVAPRFFQTFTGAHPASYTMGTGSFPGIKRPRRSIDRPSPSNIKVKERLELYLYSPSGLSCFF